MSLFILSGCGIGLTEMKKDEKEKNAIPMPVVRPYIVTIEKSSLFLVLPNNPGNEMEFKTADTLEGIIQGARKSSSAKENDLQMTEALAPYISMTKTRIGMNNDQIIIINAFSYKADEIEKQTGQPFVLDLKGGLVGAFRNWKQNLIKDVKYEGLIPPGVDRSTYTLRATTLNGIKGESQRGTCKLSFDNDASYRFRSVCFSYDSDFWMVTVFTREPDKGLPSKTDSIINSIEIEPKGSEHKFADGAGYKGEE